MMACYYVVAFTTRQKSLPDIEIFNLNKRTNAHNYYTAVLVVHNMNYMHHKI